MEKLNTPQIPEILRSERLVIRPIDETYAQEAFEALDEDVVRHMSFSVPDAVEDTLKWVKEGKEKMKNGTDYIVYAFKNDTNEFIGGGGVHHIDTRTPELGIWTKVSSHGNKYGQEIVRTLKEWVDDNLDYDYLLYPVVDVNIPSRKVAESLGGVLGRSYTDTNEKGETMNLVEYRIYRDQEQKETDATE